MEPPPRLPGDPCPRCERGMPDEDYHGECPKSETIQNDNHAPDEEYSISVEETLVSSLSGCATSPKAFTSIAIQMSTLQASFAEKTAAEMKQIVDWYSSNNKEDLFIKVTQSQAFPENPLACLDDDHNRPTKSEQFRQEQKQGDLECKSIDYSTPKSNDAITTDDDQSTESLPDLAISPSSIESPQAKVSTSSWEAQKQHQEVQGLVEATKHMAHVITEYDHQRWASDEISPIQNTGISRRRKPRTLTMASSQKVGIQRCRNSLDRESRTHQNWFVTVVVAVLFGTLAWYCCGERRFRSSDSYMSRWWHEGQ